MCNYCCLRMTTRTVSGMTVMGVVLTMLGVTSSFILKQECFKTCLGLVVIRVH